MQRLELPHETESIHCPYCGQAILAPGPDDVPQIQPPCPHTLFVAHDEGIEYRSPTFDRITGLPEHPGDDDLPDGGLDALTDAIELRGGIKFAIYIPAPVFWGVYYGFWPGGE